MTSNKGELELEVYPLDQNHFIGTIAIDEDENSTEIQTVIILDESRYIGRALARVFSTIIPLILSKLFYKASQIIDLVTIYGTSRYYRKTFEEMKTFSIPVGGDANMGSTFKEVHKLFESLDPSRPVRVLTIASGQFTDRAEAENAALPLITFLNASHFSINSQAVRLFTSNSNPDTKALCSLLQINNTTTCQLADIDVKESDETIATKIANLFRQLLQ